MLVFHIYIKNSGCSYLTWPVSNMEISLCVSDLCGPPAIQLWERISLMWSPEVHRSPTHQFKWFVHEGQPIKRIWFRSDRWWPEGRRRGLFWKLLYTSPTIMCWTTEGLLLKIFNRSIYLLPYGQSLMICGEYKLSQCDFDTGVAI